MTDVDVAPVSPDSAEARLVLSAYFGDLVSRHHGRAATREEVAAAMDEEPSADLRPPHGLLLVARADGAVIGCAGLVREEAQLTSADSAVGRVRVSWVPWPGWLAAVSSPP